MNNWYGKLGLFVLALGLGVFTAGCESEDDNNIMKAQDCLNKVTDQGASAAACRSYVSGLTTQQAYMLRCSIEFVYGGLNTEKVKNAFQEMSNNSNNANPEEFLIQNLSLIDPNGSGSSDNTALAKTAYDYCALSGSAGLIYVAGLSRIGTLIINAGGGNFEANLSACTGPTPTADCDPEEIGETVAAVADSYCVGDNVNSDVCQSFLDAQANGENNEAIGNYILENWSGS